MTTFTEIYDPFSLKEPTLLLTYVGHPKSGCVTLRHPATLFPLCDLYPMPIKSRCDFRADWCVAVPIGDRVDLPLGMQLVDAPDFVTQEQCLLRARQSSSESP